MDKSSQWLCPFAPTHYVDRLAKYSTPNVFSPLVRLAQYVFFANEYGVLSVPNRIPRYTISLSPFCQPDHEGFPEIETFEEAYEDTPLAGAGGFIEVGLLAQYLAGAIEMSIATQKILRDELWLTRSGSIHVPYPLESQSGETMTDVQPHLHSFTELMFPQLMPYVYRQLQTSINEDMGEIEYFLRLIERANSFHPTLALILFETLVNRISDWNRVEKEFRFLRAGLDNRRARSKFCSPVDDRDARIFFMNRCLKIPIEDIFSESQSNHWEFGPTDIESMKRSVRALKQKLTDFVAFQGHSNGVSRREEFKDVPIAMTFETYFSRIIKLSPEERTKPVQWIFDIDGRD